MSYTDETFSLFGRDLFGNEIKPVFSGPLKERFTFPPFTVFDARSGEWQDRKRAWASLGIAGEIGRDAVSIHCPTSASSGPLADAAYTSIFDPVLCELAYRWFSPHGGQVVDPFAGGSVRGIVAGSVGRKYWGCDLRPEQIEANERQAKDIAPAIRPVWVCGDSMDALDAAPDADLIFSCPPYGDLEKYSSDPRDLSAMEWETFRYAYRRIILRSIQRLKPNRFACFVVGDFRDAKGFYRNFVGETVAAFEECNARLYNEAVVVTPVGSASMRVTKQFNSGRKLVKTHQNLLVFCSGDWREAAKACGSFDAKAEA